MECGGFIYTKWSEFTCFSAGTPPAQYPVGSTGADLESHLGRLGPNRSFERRVQRRERRGAACQAKEGVRARILSTGQADDGWDGLGRLGAATRSCPVGAWTGHTGLRRPSYCGEYYALRMSRHGSRALRERGERENGTEDALRLAIEGMKQEEKQLVGAEASLAVQLAMSKLSQDAYDLARTQLQARRKAIRQDVAPPSGHRP